MGHALQVWRGILTVITSTSVVTKTPATSADCKCIVESLPSASLYGYLLTLPPSPSRFTSNSWAANSTTVPLVNTTVTLTIDSPCSGFLHRAILPLYGPALPVLEAVKRRQARDKLSMISDLDYRTFVGV